MPLDGDGERVLKQESVVFFRGNDGWQESVLPVGVSEPPPPEYMHMMYVYMHICMYVCMYVCILHLQ